MNFLKKNKFSIFVFIVVFIVFIISDNEVETNNEAIEESFKWGRAIIIGIVVGGYNLLNHYFFNDKN
tara:strand:+ start:704 stop:904 length:201 start_codon:yes stop_codon:yes gene_type:complete